MALFVLLWLPLFVWIEQHTTSEVHRIEFEFNHRFLEEFQHIDLNGYSECGPSDGSESVNCLSATLLHLKKDGLICSRLLSFRASRDALGSDSFGRRKCYEVLVPMHQDRHMLKLVVLIYADLDGFDKLRRSISDVVILLHERVIVEILDIVEQERAVLLEKKKKYIELLNDVEQPDGVVFPRQVAVLVARIDLAEINLRLLNRILSRFNDTSIDVDILSPIFHTFPGARHLINFVLVSCLSALGALVLPLFWTRLQSLKAKSWF